MFNLFDFAYMVEIFRIQDQPGRYQQYFIINIMVDQEKLKNYKVIIVGKSSVGKSTILLRYSSGKFTQQVTTVAVDYQFKQFTIGKKKFNLEIWDTAGQQRYRTIVYSFFKLSKAACVVFDLSSQSSLDEVENWMEQLDVHCGPELPKVLIGNKSDLFTPMALVQELKRIEGKIEKIKQKYNCAFYAVSAKNGQNIQQVFTYIAQRVAMNIDNQKPQQGQAKIKFKLDDPKIKQQTKRKRDRCCS